MEFCPGCGEPIPGYNRPAGFWIRLGAYIIDGLVFIPIVGLGRWNTFSLKSTMLVVLIAVPGFLYKPCMESFFGATLGKMACGIKVINAQGRKLNLFYAYVRAFLFLLGAGFGMATNWWCSPRPRFKRATMTSANMPPALLFVRSANMVLTGLILIDCVFAGFTFRKRALHDYLADSYVIYKEPVRNVHPTQRPTKRVRFHLGPPQDEGTLKKTLGAVQSLPGARRSRALGRAVFPGGLGSSGLSDRSPHVGYVEEHEYDKPESEEGSKPRPPCFLSDTMHIRSVQKVGHSAFFLRDLVARELQFLTIGGNPLLKLGPGVRLLHLCDWETWHLHLQLEFEHAKHGRDMAKRCVTGGSRRFIEPSTRWPLSVHLFGRIRIPALKVV